MEELLEVLFRRCAGLDVHKKSVDVSARLVDEQGHEEIVRGRFGTTLANLEELAAWLDNLGVTHVAMERTGPYWKAIYNVLSEHCEVWIVNVRPFKGVPGRGADVSDADWISLLMQYGLLERSFI